MKLDRRTDLATAERALFAAQRGCQFAEQRRATFVDIRRFLTLLRLQGSGMYEVCLDEAPATYALTL
jgi:hypothetical protein